MAADTSTDNGRDGPLKVQMMICREEHNEL